MSRPRLLDLFCGAGGAAVGYARAGFEVVGVDVVDQPHYPFEFHRCDARVALGVVIEWGDSNAWGHFDAIHASPPCQAYSDARTMWNARDGHPDLVEPTRELLKAAGLPWVMENVEGAPMAKANDLFGTKAATLCGSMFDLMNDRYELRRHRLFECSFPVEQPQCSHGRRPKVIGFYGDHARTNGARANGDLSAGEGMAMAREVMGIDWCNWRGVSQAIPPAYTEFIGAQLLAHLSVAAAPPSVTAGED